MPAITSILAGASALPGLFDVGKDIFGGGDSGGNTGYASVDPQGQQFNKYLMDYMQQKLSQPHQYRPVPQMPYNIMNMVSQAYGMGPYQDPGWAKSGGGPSSPGGPMGMPMGSIGKGQLQAPGAQMPQPNRRRIAQ